MDAVLIQYPDPNCSGCTIHLGFWQTYMVSQAIHPGSSSLWSA